MKCPICSSTMNPIDTAPCYDCGHMQSELDEFRNDEHEYHWFKVFGQTIILCDFCDADFGSYFPDYFGLPGRLSEYGEYPLKMLKKVEKPEIEKDYYCEKCQHRLAFLQFLKLSREINQSTSYPYGSMSGSCGR